MGNQVTALAVALPDRCNARADGWTLLTVREHCALGPARAGKGAVAHARSLPRDPGSDPGWAERERDKESVCWVFKPALRLGFWWLQ